MCQFKERMPKLIEKQDPAICFLHFKYKDTYRLKINGWKNYPVLTLMRNSSISDRVDFKARKVIRNKK